jgi:catalase (peroxidase I)
LNYYFENLFNFEWELTKSPAGAYQWEAKDAPEIIPDPFADNMAVTKQASDETFLFSSRACPI